MGFVACMHMYIYICTTHVLTKGDLFVFLLYVLCDTERTVAAL